MSLLRIQVNLLIEVERWKDKLSEIVLFTRLGVVILIVLDELIDLRLRKRHDKWLLTVPDKTWHVMKRFDYTSENQAVKHYTENLDDTIGYQNTSYQSLHVPKELVAEWVLNDFGKDKKVVLEKGNKNIERER